MTRSVLDSDNAPAALGTLRILGVDPGFGATGLGIVDWDGRRAALVHHEIFRPPASGPREIRLEAIHRAVALALERFKPARVVLEDLFYHKSFRAATRLAEARSMVMLAAAQAGVPVQEVLPTRVKQAVCGNGHAAKQQVAFMVRHLLGLREPMAPDETDALAIALSTTHAQNP